LDPSKFKEKLLDSPVLTIYTSTNDNKALYMISHLRGEVSTSYFKPSTPLGSTITQRKIIG
jgi:hypothetical protein